jgi:hypothetical protein
MKPVSALGSNEAALKYNLLEPRLQVHTLSGDTVIAETVINLVKESAIARNNSTNQSCN